MLFVKSGARKFFFPKARTTWGTLRVGDQVNLEIDTLARYVARLAETV